ncbi:hypothetical protein B0A52_04024 [Exophiala mesophila]|uniref:Uncharacterized protein n=1 Tax=Exophiala mesophila TaxID=212818 RepID=A0A438NA29_EXOME|nr:hypothetical protein B0A52_04024 [Exophiala mesophila]
MSLELDEKALESVANNGEMDYDKWPALIEPLLQRLNDIVYNEFPLPRPYQNITRAAPPTSPSLSQSTPTRDPNSTTQAPSTPVRNLPPVPPFPNSSATSTSHVPDSLPPSQDPSSRDNNVLTELPTLLLQLLTGTIQTLRTSFSDKPPHTIQRLAELVLRPKAHYKTLPAWLRALDRVVSVSSPADIFPLSEAPLLVNGVNGDRSGGGILWNNNTDARNGYDRDSLGSDESLGGALLTPIPWLRNGMAGSSSDDDIDAGDHSGSSLDANGILGSDGSSGDGMSLIGSQGSADPMVPDREDGGVTQGELMRMEQEAGVVPLTQNLADTSSRIMGDDVDDDEDEDQDQGAYQDDGDNIPHARGPDVVGSVDLGRVGGKDVQLHIGSPPSTSEGGVAGEEIVPDPNNAQTVLPTTQPSDPPSVSTTIATNDPTITSASPADDFEIILKEDAETDAMQLDEMSDISSAQASGAATDLEPSDSGAEKDGDIVLVDADGYGQKEDNQKKIETPPATAASPQSNEPNPDPDTATTSTAT